CPTCKKCLYSANHDECVLQYLSKLNPRASAQIKDAKSHNTKKRYVPVEKTSESKKLERLIPKGHRFSHKKTTTVPEKTRTPISVLGGNQRVEFSRLFVLGGFQLESYSTLARARPHSSMFKKMFDRSRSSLGLHQMTSDHNHSELRIQDHRNEQSSSKLVPKVVP
ncbi:hypothetical protein Tco_0095094, partial [Tanacetum coccineum]